VQASPWRLSTSPVFLAADCLLWERIDRLAYGHLGDAKPVGEGVTELRVHIGPGYRVYVTRRGDTITVLLCGGDKASQARDIVRAKALMNEL
jgi:putative addiction module killer protein